MSGKNPIFIGIDTGRDDWTTEVLVERLPDGTVNVLAEHRYKTTIELGRDEYRSDGECGRKQEG